MAAVSTVLFPEGYAAEAFSETPLAGQLAVGDADNRAEQVSERGRTLMAFTLRTEPLDVVGATLFHDFVDQCGSGAVNFTFYKPYSEFFTSIVVAYADGVLTSFYVPFRNMNSWTNILVSGVDEVGATVSNEALAPTKEDQVTIGAPHTAGEPISLSNLYARQRYICRMQSWRRSMYASGYAQALSFDPLTPLVPLMLTQYEFSFREKV